MGNCMDTAALVDNNTAYPSRGGSRSGLSLSTSTNKSGSTRTTFTHSYSNPSELPTSRTEGEILSSPYLKAFAFGDLKNATKNFRPDSLIGEGGFGCVYKGWIDEETLAPSKPGTGMVVAVKKLKPEGFQGHKEWLTEVDYLGQLHHQNLVKLIGYCSDGDNRLLVYELMPKGSLENHLFRRGADPLPWGIRLKVAIGAARGLSFLHDDENQVIYRDFKASNILLDSEFNAKLSDFGLAKAGPTGDRTHVSTQVMGTRGYAAPEYIATDPSRGGSRSGLSLSTSTNKSGSTRTTFTHSYSNPSELPTSRTEGEILSSPYLKAFAFGDLKNATKNFRPDSLIGEGGFGCVYKGWIDEETLAPSKPGTGMVVAVKKLKPEGFQGHKEWLTEVDYLGQLHHQNLVKLIGYCSDGDNRLLVYELMPKGSLENHLFRRGADPLPWGIRLKVAIGAARGLSFLHDDENQVIYRDFKASNILLDSEFNAKLSDFGLAKAGPTGDRTHVSTQVMGTRGYAAPEYIATGRLSVKADVYSFGVVLLELLTGRRALDKSKPTTEQNLVDWTRPYLGDKRRLYRIMDMKLCGQYPKKGAQAIAGLAQQCICMEAKMRPQISEVLEKLEELQDPKYNVTAPQVDTRRTSSGGSVPRSPMSMRAQPSSRRLSASASPFQVAGSPLSASRTAQVY